MSSTDFISGLVATARPIRKRRIGQEAMVLMAIGVLQLAGLSSVFSFEALERYVAMDPARMALKLGLTFICAIGFSALALKSLTPGARRIGEGAVTLGGIALIAALIGFDKTMPDGIGSALMPQYGATCLMTVTALALPVTLALALFAVRGASTQLNRTALMIGLAGGSWGAFAYALQCPFVGLYYLCTWYLGAVVLVGLLSRLLLPRIARW